MKGGWALFLSGRGSTAQALLDRAGDLDIRLVVSSKRKAPGVLRAHRAGIRVLLITKESSWDQVHIELRRAGVRGIFLVGFMRILPALFVERWQGRIWNIHPSLLPAYPGAGAMEKSFQEKADMGVSLHEVTAEMDAGPLRLQKRVERHVDWDQTRLRMARAEQFLLREWSRRLQARPA